VDGERSRGAVAGAVAAFQPAGMCAGARLAVVGNGAMLWLLARRAGAPLRSQPELGLAPAGAGGAFTRSHSATGARGPDRAADGNEVSGPGCTHQRAGLRANGRGVRTASLRYAAVRTALCRLARWLARGSRAHSLGAGAVSEDAAAITGAGRSAGSRAAAGTRHGGRDSAARHAAALRCRGGDERRATATGAATHRKRAPRTRPDCPTDGR
jgi:hypothetical protein